MARVLDTLWGICKWLFIWIVFFRQKSMPNCLPKALYQKCQNKVDIRRCPLTTSANVFVVLLPQRSGIKMPMPWRPVMARMESVYICPSSNQHSTWNTWIGWCFVFVLGRPPDKCYVSFGECNQPVLRSKSSMIPTNLPMTQAGTWSRWTFFINFILWMSTILGAIFILPKEKIVNCKCLVIFCKIQDDWFQDVHRFSIGEIPWGHLMPWFQGIVGAAATHLRGTKLGSGSGFWSVLRKLAIENHRHGPSFLSY